MWGDGIDTPSPMFGPPGGPIMSGSIWGQHEPNNMSFKPSGPSDSPAWGQPDHNAKPPQNWNNLSNSSGPPTFQPVNPASSHPISKPWDSVPPPNVPGGWTQNPQQGGPPGPGWSHSNPQPTPTPQAGTNWGAPQQGQHAQAGWGGPPGTSPGGGARSWSDVARPAQQQPPPVPPASATTNAGPPGRPILANVGRSGNFDNGTAGWGKPVDQGTPWEPGAARKQENNAPSWGTGPNNNENRNDSNNWSSGGGGGGAGGVSVNSSNRNSDMHWTAPPPDNPNLMWQAPAKPEPQAQVHNQQQPQWGGVSGNMGGPPGGGGGGSMWDNSSGSMVRSNGPGPYSSNQQPQQQAGPNPGCLNPHQQSFGQAPSHQNMMNNSVSSMSSAMPMQGGHGGNMWDAPPNQGPPPSNVWQNPNTQQPKHQESNVWQDPSPQVKRTPVPDKGTGIWGDPVSQATQGDIKRWKTNLDEAAAAPIPQPPSTAAMQPPSLPQPPQQQSQTGLSWNSAPANVGNTNPALTANKMQQAQPGGSWGDQAPSSWNNTPVAPPPKAITNSQGAWPESQTPTWNKQENLSSPTKGISNGWDNMTTNPANNIGAFGATPPELQNGSAADDGFSVVSPTSPFDQPRLAGGSQAPNALDGAQNAFNNARGANGAVGNLIQMRKTPLKEQASGGVQLQLLTAQIADQLRYAVGSGLIDVNLLQQPLPQPTLLLLNQLLHHGTRLEQAEKELKDYQQRSSHIPLNAPQLQEYQRIQQEIKQLKQEVLQLQQQIKTQTATVSVSGQVNGTANSTATSQAPTSRLMTQWIAPSENEDAKNADVSNSLSPSTLQLSLESQFGSVQLGGSNDMWGQTAKSGSNWPTSPSGVADTTGKHSDSPKRGASAATIGATQATNGQPQKYQIMTRRTDGSDSNSDASKDINALDKGPPEFKPGQPWNWNDPSKDVDENTTPQDWQQKQRSNLSIASLGAVDPESRLMKDDMMPKPPVGQMVGIVGDFWSGSSGGMARAQAMGLNSRPPSQVGNPFPPAMPGGRQMRPSWPTNLTQQSAFAPYSASPSPFILLNNVGPQINGELIKQFCFRAGTVETFTYQPGAPFAVVRYKDYPIERILHTLSAEFAPYGISVNLARDHQHVDNLLMAASSQMMPPPPPPPMVGGYGGWETGPLGGPGVPVPMPPFDSLGLGFPGGPLPDVEHHMF